MLNKISFHNHFKFQFFLAFFVVRYHNVVWPAVSIEQYSIILNTSVWLILLINVKIEVIGWTICRQKIPDNGIILFNEKLSQDMTKKFIPCRIYALSLFLNVEFSSL